MARKIAITGCIAFTASAISMPATYANEPIFSTATIQPTVKVVSGGIEITIQEESEIGRASCRERVSFFV